MQHSGYFLLSSLLTAIFRTVFGDAEDWITAKV
jgi:hypothetical protein